VKRLRIAAIILIVIACGLALFFYANETIFSTNTEGLKKNPNKKPLFLEGERLVYDVYYKKLKIGESVLVFHGEKEIDGIPTYHITFSTALPGFEDIENIYAHKETFLPLRVNRSIKRAALFPLKIQEEYDQNAYSIRIKQQGALLSKEFTIQKGAPIHNAILLPYYYRAKPLIAEGEKIKITLPTADYEIFLEEKKAVTTPSGEYSVYAFKSDPPKFTFWLSTDEKKIPVKVEGHAALGYSLILRSIEKKERTTYEYNKDKID